MEFRDDQLLGVKDLMELLGVGKAQVMKILAMPGCPMLPRGKNEIYRVPYGKFKTWFWRQCK